MRSARNWHRWIGLLLGALFALQGLSGALLLFRAPLNRLLHPAAFTGLPPVDGPALDRAVAAVRGAAPACTMTRIDLPVQGGDPLLFTLTCDGQPWVATAGGEADTPGRLAPLWQWPMEWLFQFHYRWAAGEPGQQAIGWVGAGLAFASLLGLWLLPAEGRRSGWRPLLAPSPTAPPMRRWRDWHRSLGLYLSPLLLVLALTGLAMAWNPTVTALLPVTPRPSPSVADRPDRAALPLSAIWSAARALAPGATVANLRLPGGHGRVVMAMLGGADSPDYDQLWFDGYDGHLIGSRWAVARAPADRVMDLFYPLHTGALFGTAGLVLALLAGLSLPFFWGTGLWLWWRRRLPGPLTVRVAAGAPDGEGVRHLVLRHRWGLPLPRFAAGDHIDVHLPGGLVRQYSLCGRPGRGRAYEIGVRLSPQSRGGSEAIHRDLSPGQTLRIGRPRSHFPLVPGAAPCLLLAGGIGVTPLLSMAWQLHVQGRPFHLVVCARDATSRPLQRLIAATPFAAACQWHDSAWSGRIDLAALLAAQRPDTQLYTCGPAPFMQAALDQARALGWGEDRLHWEDFAPATPAGPAFSVALETGGHDLPVAEDESLLDRLLAEGWAIPHSCRRGLCGQCVVTVISGPVAHHDAILSDEDHAAGLMTSCCSRAAVAGDRLVVRLPVA